MAEYILILFVTVCIVWYIAKNRGYKKGIKFGDDAKFSEGYKRGVKTTEKEFYDMCNLSDDDLMDRINEIRKKIKNLTQ